MRIFFSVCLVGLYFAGPASGFLKKFITAGVTAGLAHTLFSGNDESANPTTPARGPSLLDKAQSVMRSASGGLESASGISVSKYFEPADPSCVKTIYLDRLMDQIKDTIEDEIRKPEYGGRYVEIFSDEPYDVIENPLDSDALHDEEGNEESYEEGNGNEEEGPNFKFDMEKAKVVLFDYFIPMARLSKFDITQLPVLYNSYQRDFGSKNSGESETEEEISPS